MKITDVGVWSTSVSAADIWAVATPVWVPWSAVTTHAAIVMFLSRIIDLHHPWPVTFTLVAIRALNLETSM